jgi:hypothetical protein
VTVEDLTFDSEWAAKPNGPAGKVGVAAVRVGGTDITVRDVDFRNVDTGVDSSMAPTGLLVMDTTVSVSYGLRGYHVWGEGTDHVYLGNSSPNSTREHNVRTSGVERVLVAYNDFANLDRTGGADGGDISKGCIEIHRGLFSYVAENTVHDGVIRIGPRGGATETPDTETKWSVIEDNRLDDVGIHVYSGSHGAMIRNNVINRYQSLRHGPAITLMAPDSDGRRSSDIFILNNTAIDTRESGSFLKLFGEADRVTVKNNLFVATNLRTGSNGSSALYVTDTDLSSFTEISGNVWPLAQPGPAWADADGGFCYVGKTWGTKGGYKTPTQWNAYRQVGTDYFEDATPHGVYRVTLHGVTAGADLLMPSA